jgi:hypothetical protein
MRPTASWQEQGSVINNRPYQAELARSLIDTLGLDGAIYACRSNAWDGVLACVLAYRASLTHRSTA